MKAAIADGLKGLVGPEQVGVISSAFEAGYQCCQVNDGYRLADALHNLMIGIDLLRKGDPCADVYVDRAMREFDHAMREFDQAWREVAEALEERPSFSPTKTSNHPTERT
jgi:hypothetical protein